ADDSKPKQLEGHDEAQTETKKPQDVDKIRIKAQLKRVAVILNNDGIRLATLSMSSAEVGVLLMGKSMSVTAKLGNLGLVDDINQGVDEKSALRQIVSIQGDDLADFRYETFDAAAKEYPGHDTAIFLRAGSLKVNFITEPLRKIMEFGVKFGKMQAIFNAAREAAANQATKVQESASKMHFDILVKTPIVSFPRLIVTDSPERDLLTAYLGEIYASNKFVPIDDSKDADTVNKLSAGIHNIRLTSSFHYDGEKSEELELIDKVDLDFNISQADHKIGRERPDTEIEGAMSNINLRITEGQLRFIMELTRSIPSAFALESDEALEEEVKEEIPNSVVKPAKAIEDKPATKKTEPEKPSHLGPELGTDSETWTKLDFIFKIGAVGLEL
ncbi:Vacuolar protein sorting-associated protein 13, partial [Oleoguttula sp. CCFEE 5521]